MASITTQPAVQNFIGGHFVRNGQKELDVFSPLDGTIISTLPLSTSVEVDQAVQAAKAAYASWSKRTLKERAQVFFNYRTLLEKHVDELTELVRLENGKTAGEARAEVLKSMELCEFAVSMPQIISNEI
ncbi:MAG: aldehyde dehydrogenase family protein, partial [Saprospiraceae bacterium]|nr:aldehyde dehydrogenase family protein [Saprospiraceae bacterium]